MTIWDLQKMSDEEVKTKITNMSRAEIKQVIDSCGTPQGKSAIKKLWEKQTGNKF